MYSRIVIRLRVREAILRSGRTQASIAAEVGLEPHKLSKSLSGSRSFRGTELRAIATAVGLSSDFFAGSDPDAAAPPAEPRGLRPRILDSAAELIARQGFDAVRISDIAAVCGVSTGTVHYHFPTRDDVLTAALKHCAERMFLRVERELAELSGDPSAQLRHLIDSQVPLNPLVRDEWSVWVQFWTHAILFPELRPAHNDLYRRWRELVHAAVSDAARAGIVDSTDPRMTAVRFTSLVDGTALRLLTGEPEMSADLMRRLLSEVFWPPSAS